MMMNAIFNVKAVSWGNNTETFPKASKSQVVDACGSIIHSGVCGPMPVNSIGGSRYFVTFIDNCSKYIHIY